MIIRTGIIMMKKYVLLSLAILLCSVARLNAQCRIEIGILPPNLCVENILCAPFEIIPANCIQPGCIQIEISQPLPTPTSPCNFNLPAEVGPGNCITIPLTFQKGRYCVRLRCGNIVSDVRTVSIDTIDVTPAPTISITQLSPIRPSYCPKDTICFKATNIANAGVGYTLQWIKNDSSLNGATDSVFCITGLIDQDFVSVRISKQNKCAINADGQSDSIRLRVNKKPKIRIVLAQGSTGCEQTVNSFIAKLDSAGTDPYIFWTRVYKGITDTLSEGINDTTFTLSPSDSVQFGDQVCAEVISGRCKLKANDCFSIKACGQVFIDPPLDTVACAGTVIRVPYTITGTFLATNVFKVQLSDAFGNFGSPVQIGTLFSKRADTIQAQIPQNTPEGNCYRVRIISSSPVDTSDISACFKVYARPVPPTTISDSVCKSGIVDLIANSSQSGVVFRWYRAPFGGIPVFTGSVRNIFITRDTVFYVSTLSPNGCESQRVAVNGVINPSPVVEAGPDRNICLGNSTITLTPFPINGTWSGNLPVLNNVIDLSGVAEGNYKLYYQVKNTIGCTTIDSFSVRVKSIPLVNAGPDTSVCTNNQPIQFPGSPNTGNWSGDNVQTDGTYLPILASPGSDTLIYSVTTDGCIGVDTLIVTVRLAPPIFTITTVNPSACNVDDGTATLTGITTGPGFTVKWSVNRADSAADPTITNLGAGAYTVRVTDNLSGCFRRGAFGLSDLLAPAPVISGLSANYCSGDACATLTVTPNSPTGTWSGTGIVTGPNGTARFCPQQANLGANEVVYSYDTTGGCTGTTSIITRLNPSPVVNAGGPADTVCSGAGTFQLTGFSPLTPPAIWSPQPLVSPTGLVNPALANLGNNVLTISRSLANCSASGTRNLFVYENPNPGISRNPLADVCVGQAITLTANNTNSAVPTRYEWFKNSIIIPNENNNTLVVAEAGSYTVSAVATGNCSALSAPIVISFNSLPTNGVTPSGILTPCANIPTALTADSSAGYSYQWYELGDPIVGATNRRFTPTSSGQYRVRIENSAGCSIFSSVVSVNILPAPQAPIISPFLADTCLQENQPITITVGASGSGLTFQWFKVGTPDVSIPGQNDPVLDTVKSAGSYYVLVEASNGCKTRSNNINILPTVRITVIDTIIQKCLGDNQFVVSGFTPNNCDLYFNGSILPGRLWNPNTPGDFLLTYQCTNSNSCVSRKNLTVRVSPQPQANLVVFGPTNVCQGDSVTLIINNGTETGCAYQLIRNGLDFGTPFTTPFFKVTQAGNYSILVTCSRCSTVSNIVPITYRKKPRADAGANFSSCSPLSVNLNTRTGVTSGTWSGSPRVVTAGNYNSASFIGCEVLSLNVDSSNGCSNTDTMTVCIDSLPSFTTSVQNSSACLAEDGLAWVTGNIAGYSFAWRKVGNATVISTDDSLKNVFPGAYQVAITTLSSGCAIVRAAVINSPNNLDVSVAGLPDSVCANGNLIFLTGIPADSGVFTSFANRIVFGNRFNPTLPGPSVDTVYYTATLNGCVGTGKKSIKINPIPVVDAGPDQEVCFGQTLVLQAVQPSGIPLIWVGPQIENDSEYVAFDPGIINSVVTFGYTKNGCSNTDSKNIKVNPIPDYNVVPSNVTSCGTCNGGAVREIVNSALYQTIWKDLSTGSVIGTGGLISNRCVGVYTAEVIQITTGCKRLESFGISGPTNINPFVCLQNVPIGLCQNEQRVILGKCRPSANIFIGGIQTDTLNPGSYFPDNIEVLLTYTDTNGCTGVEQKNVEIKAVPSVSVSGTGPGFACTSQTAVQLTNFFPAYSPAVPENGWSVVGPAPAGFITKSGLINPSVVTNDAVFTLKYTAKFAEPNGCSESKNILFRVYRTPVAVIQPAVPSLTICEGTTTPLTSLNTAPGLTYRWFRGNLPNPTAIGFTSTYQASLPGFYSLQLNNNGCLSLPSGLILLNTTPAPIIANIGSDLTICQSNPILLEPPTVVGATTTQCWETVTNAPVGFITCSGNVNPAVVNPGQYTVRFVASNGTCSDTATRVLSIVKNVNSTITTVNPDQVQEVCDGQFIKLTADSAGTGYSYQWLKNGIPIPDSINNTLHVFTSGEYKVKILINGIGTCALASTDFVLVTVKPSPVVTVSGDSTIKVCFPDAPFDLNTLRPYTPLDAIWSATNNIVTPNGLVRPVNIPSDGNYVLTLTKTIGNCTSSKKITLIANKIPSAVFDASAQAICQGQTITLTYVNPLNYKTTWLRGNSVIALDTNTVVLSTAGNYKLIVDNNGCTAETSTAFEVRPTPTFDLPQDTESCKNGVSQQFFPINPSEGLGTWSGPGINNTGGWDPSSPEVPSSGPITLSYTRTLDGCFLTKSFKVEINPVPAITLNTNKDTIEIYGPATLTATGGILYQWSPSSTLNSATGPEVFAKPAETTDYTVNVTTDKGCKGQEQIRIIVDQEFKIYDAVSPNGDQKNDTWIIKNIQRYPNAVVKIFNRWGNLVYESEKGYPKPWDGSFEGNQVPPGAYYFIVDLGQGLTPKSGSITVVR